MIEILIRRAPDRSIRGFKVSGHANYDEPGKDIVCAGVSAVTVGSINSVEALTGIVLPNRMQSGYLEATVPAKLEEGQKERIGLILESMLIMLRTIEQSYRDFVVIRETTE